MEVSKENLVKYPFTSEAVEYIKAKTRAGDVLLADFEKPELELVVERAEERIREALEKGVVSYRSDLIADVELLSFPLALALVKAIGDPFLRHRYALAESERVRRALREEEPNVVLKIAREVLDWKAEFTGFKTQYDYALSIRDYLDFAPRFHHESWKLVNKPVKNGYVYLTKRDFIRLIAEGVKAIIEDETVGGLRERLPSRLREAVGKIKLLLSEKRPKTSIPERGKGGVVAEAFPPCMRNFYQALLEGEQLSHVARFSVTSFLLNVGVETEDVVQLFTRTPDANERITRYQVEHIAGLRGAKTKYTPPSCKTLKTHGLCVENGKFCRGIKHPLTYYRRALRRLGKVGGKEKHQVSEKSV